ncbi:retrovirus-related Pol polyprotein from transposon TNT 1-94, partial [Trifolium medium]|nr:retrovirus-related Pol polyprotein from transposon TNT 1-94 [Trifolium medium]
PDGLYSFGALQPTPPGAISSSSPSVPPGAISSSSPSVHTLTSLNALPLNSFANNTANSLGTTTYSLWHNRLGHPHYEALKAALNACNTSIPVQSKLDFCASCCLGKIHRLPSTTSTTVYHAPFDLMFADVWGPAPMLSFSGFKYLLTCVDAYTKLTCPHTHHQNGSVERKHRHVVETGLTLLAQAHLPLKFWDYAFMTATYLINRAVP